MTLFELQEYCLANAVDAVICGDTMTVEVADSADYRHCIGTGYLDEPVSWILPVSHYN